MIKRYLSLFVFLTIGVVIGMLWSEGHIGVKGTTGEQQTQAGQAGARPYPTLPVEQQRISNLEVELAQMKQRLERLERLEQQPTAVEPPDPDDNLVSEAGYPTVRVAPGSSRNPLLVVEGLVAAGLDSFTAQEIARRQSELELQRLEIRDNAMREGYIGTERFREELTELREQQVRVRDEIDPAAYDKYLYYTGQPNRVGVSSVLLGSAAEESGIREGDMILRYENEPLYNRRDLQSATVQGERDEFVDVTVQRGDSVFTVAVPRGPLGVRLNSLVINPEDQ